MRVRFALLGCLLLAAAPSMAQDPDDPLAALVEQERIRQIVETALGGVGEARRRYADDTAFVEAYTDLVWALGNEDPAVVPLLANEILQSDPRTFFPSIQALAFHGTPEAREALFAAIARAEGEDTEFAIDRKAHLIRALGAAGDVRAVVLADEGRHHVGRRPMHRGMSVIETAALMTVPESIEILNAELAEPGLPLPEARPRTLYALRAVRRAADPSSLPVLLRWAAEENSRAARNEGLRGLGLQRGKRATDALFAALEGERTSSHLVAARALSTQLPEGGFDRVVEALGRANDPRVRAHLYKALVGLDAAAAIPVLRRYAATPHSADRTAICQAASRIDSPEILDLMIEQVGSGAVQAAVCALKALARIDSPRARRVVIRAIDSPNWPTALTASRLTGRLGWNDAAPAMRTRLQKRDFPKLLRDTTDRDHAEWFIDQLVNLEDLESIAVFEQALETQKQASLRRKLEAGLVVLRAARDAGDDVDKWEALASGEDEALRKLAYRHLGRGLHGEADAEVLRRALSRVEPPESILILQQLGRIDGEASRAAIERVLTAPEYQRPELYAVRDMAAWSARRLGGERMQAALRQSVELRLGRDLRPILYYAQLAGPTAAPLIEGLLPGRLRFSSVFRGLEHDMLRELVQALENGRSIAHLDLPPNEIVFQ